VIIDPGQSNMQKMKSSNRDGYFSCSVLRHRFAVGLTRMVFSAAGQGRVFQRVRFPLRQGGPATG